MEAEARDVRRAIVASRLAGAAPAPVGDEERDIRLAIAASLADEEEPEEEDWLVIPTTAPIGAPVEPPAPAPVGPSAPVGPPIDAPVGPPIDAK